MSASTASPRDWHQMELLPGHTAIQLHWPHGVSGTPTADAMFALPRILKGETLHQLLDTLLAEYALSSDGIPVITEITLWWHEPNGHWHTETHISHSEA